VASAPRQSDTKRRLQQEQQRWLQEIVNATGMKLSQIAVRAGVSDTTLTRLANDETYGGTLSPLTIERIKESLRVPGPEEYGARRPGGFAGFAEAERFDGEREPQALAAAVMTLIGDRPAIDPWRLKTEALIEAGYLPGDIVLVDLNATPEPQDAVCAQVYDWQRGAAETVWRVFDPPFLVGAARDRTAYKPLLVDNERVVVKGVLMESLRPHRLSKAR
jgi:transcriptional regulator with XRE-family HTH domain